MSEDELTIREVREGGVRKLVAVRAGEILAALSYGPPRGEEYRWRFSGELYDFSPSPPHRRESRHGTETMLELLVAFVTHYCEVMIPPPADFFVPREEAEMICDSVGISKEKLAETLRLVETSEGNLAWRDENRTYYSYRITASDSAKYYIGVSHVKKANASEEECLEDGYYGSGGAGRKNKFNNWRKRHRENLRKEILGIHNTRMRAFREERELVGDAWRDDPLCLNSRPGGEVRPPHGASGEVARCPEHGETWHQGERCARCVRASSVGRGFCGVHGEVTLRGSRCERCIGERAISEGHCEKHGAVTLQGSTCSSCTTESIVSERQCERHGLTAFRGEHCARCLKLDSQSLRRCPIHGLVKFTGERCNTCLIRESYSLETCEVHGESKHQRGRCVACRPSPVSSKECSVHGLSKHRGDSCYRCAAARRRRRGEDLRG